MPSSFWQMGQIGGPSIWWVHWVANFTLYIKSVRQSMTSFFSPEVTLAFFQTELLMSFSLKRCLLRYGCVHLVSFLTAYRLLTIFCNWTASFAVQTSHHFLQLDCIICSKSQHRACELLCIKHKIWHNNSFHNSC